MQRLPFASWLDLDPGLIKPRKPSRKLLRFVENRFGSEYEHLSSTSVRFASHDMAATSDMVAVQDLHNRNQKWHVAQIIWRGSTAGVCYCAVQGFQLVMKKLCSSTWREHGKPQLVDVDDILEVLIYKTVGKSIIALHPLSLVVA